MTEPDIFIIVCGAITLACGGCMGWASNYKDLAVGYSLVGVLLILIGCFG